MDGGCGWLWCIEAVGGLAVIGVGGSRGSGCGHWCCLTQPWSDPLPPPTKEKKVSLKWLKMT